MPLSAAANSVSPLPPLVSLFSFFPYVAEWGEDKAKEQDQPQVPESMLSNPTAEFCLSDIPDLLAIVVLPA